MPFMSTTNLVSSTRIRELVREGEMIGGQGAAWAQFYQIRGTVQIGKQRGGQGHRFSYRQSAIQRGRSGSEAWGLRDPGHMSTANATGEFSISAIIRPSVKNSWWRRHISLILLRISMDNRSRSICSNFSAVNENFPGPLNLPNK